MLAFTISRERKQIQKRKRSRPLKFRTFVCLLGAVTVVSMLFPAVAHADYISGITGVDGQLPNVEGNSPIASGSSLYATGGDVTIILAGVGLAADTDVLVNGMRVLISNQDSLGTTVDLGNFYPGQGITFAVNNETTGAVYYTGLAELNPDGMVHAAYAPWTANGAFDQNGTFIGFEDLPASQSDRDYNDLSIVVSNVAVAPEPTSLFFLGTGLAGLAASYYNKKKRGFAASRLG